MQPEDSAFRAFYDSDLIPVLKLLEVERKKLNKDLFEISGSSSFLNYNQLKAYINDLQLATGNVEELNLNTRIWSKV